ncbi:NAD(P)-binding protein [Dendrothele bispora CBS 962.96]|uniref:NAD(P)-binding protein n=1 Tax=Dendrothele bispora (strain CBS 962.96) TaxID=1314807 RepID=A0A4S8LTN3_DENBC|nr:NAD(P)-binding protein [Dendrothele bispora CBS 962.96]
MELRKQEFSSFPTIAVVGASIHNTKISAQIVRYLLKIHKTVIPVNPNHTTIQGLKSSKSILDLPNPERTVISVVVRPSTTLEVLKQAMKIGIPYIWLQPGAEDTTVLSYIKSTPDLEKRCIYPSTPLVASSTGPNCPDTIIPASAIDNEPSKIVHASRLDKLRSISATTEIKPGSDEEPCLLKDLKGMDVSLKVDPGLINS